VQAARASVTLSTTPLMPSDRTNRKSSGIIVDHRQRQPAREVPREVVAPGDRVLVVGRHILAMAGIRLSARAILIAQWVPDALRVLVHREST